MKIFVRVKTGAKEEFVEQVDQDNYEVAVSARPVDGRANQAVVEALALHFNTAPSSVRLIAGGKSRHKIFEIKGF